MYKKLKIILIFFSLICICSTCANKSNDIQIEEVSEEYELFFSYGVEADLYMRRHLIDYFKMLALGSEYGTGFPLVKKWTKPMQIYVSGHREEILSNELNSIIDELNELFTDGFDIRLVNDSLESNFHIYFGDTQTYSELYPGDSQCLDENLGLFTFYFDSDFNITSGHMFVNTSATNLITQKHLLREELTHSLGLPNDLKYYNNSIFYDQASSVVAYSNLDIEVIRLLYHPGMIPGIGAATVQSILETILGI